MSEKETKERKMVRLANQEKNDEKISKIKKYNEIQEKEDQQEAYKSYNAHKKDVESRIASKVENDKKISNRTYNRAREELVINNGFDRSQLNSPGFEQ